MLTAEFFFFWKIEISCAHLDISTLQQVRTLMFFPVWSYESSLFLGLAHADQACSPMICISACTQIRPKSLHFDASARTYPLAFVLVSGLPQQDQAYLLKICVWACTNNRPKITHISSLQRVRTSSFPFSLGLAYCNQSLVLTVCILAYL